MWGAVYVCVEGVFFFKQKTAYEMRISDWSLDVCSSDLIAETLHEFGDALEHAEHVVGHQHLAVALRRSTDADRRAVDLVRDFDRDRFEHAFDDDRKGASLRHRDRILDDRARFLGARSEEHTSELQSLMRISYDVFCLKKK